MNTLDIDQFLALPKEQQADIKAWMSAHGLDPDAVFLVSWDGRKIRAKMYARNHYGRFYTTLAGDVKVRTITVRKVHPFPASRDYAA